MSHSHRACCGTLRPVELSYAVKGTAHVTRRLQRTQDSTLIVCDRISAKVSLTLVLQRMLCEEWVGWTRLQEKPATQVHACPAKRMFNPISNLQVRAFPWLRQLVTDLRHGCKRCRRLRIKRCRLQGFHSISMQRCLGLLSASGHNAFA